MKAIMLCGGAANQRALAHRLRAIVPLSHIARIAAAPVPVPLCRRLVSFTLESRSAARGGGCWSL